MKLAKYLVVFAPLITGQSGIAASNSPHLTRLYSFPGAPDGYEPNGGMVMDQNGVLYGTTRAGGAHYGGTVFSLTPPAAPGSSWTESILYSFTGGSDGGTPTSGLALGSGGVLYGTTYVGGISTSGGYGTVFSLSPPAAPGGAWTETVLHAFQGGADAAYPVGGVAIGAGGILYGASISGGSPYGFDGTVFSVTPPNTPGGAWSEAVLWSFSNGTSTEPQAGLAIGKSGALYGIARSNSPNGGDNAFALTPPAVAGGSWKETDIYALNGYYYGSSAMAIDGDGVLYGTTVSISGQTNGTVFMLTPPSFPGDSWTQEFPYPAIGNAAVVLDADGAIYGAVNGQNTPTAGGEIFKLKPAKLGGWNFSVLHIFDGYKFGRNPAGGLTIGSHGEVYGVTQGGGASYVGCVFRISR